MKKILVVVGARPNFMKVARFKEVAATYGDLKVELVHTGQHSDAAMTSVFFEQFRSTPDHVLEIPEGSPIERIAHMMLALGSLIEKSKPDLMVVVGDVDSTLAGALVANRCGIPLVHLESGLRSGDLSMPEEVNRIVVDRIADHLLITESSARYNLLQEGREAVSIHFVGNTMIDTMVQFAEEIQASSILEDLDLQPGGHVLATMHRPATVDVKAGLEDLVQVLKDLSRDLKVVYPVHPRTRKNMEQHGLWKELRSSSGILLLEPLDYFSFQKLLDTSLCVLTDSGGVQEETTFRGIPCLTLRPNTERPVTIEEGTNQLVPFDIDKIRNAVEQIRSGNWPKGRIPELWDGRATERVFEVLRSVI